MTTTETDYRAIFDPDVRFQHGVAFCPVCSHDGQREHGPNYDRYGFIYPPTTCEGCGLVYLLQHIGAKAYAEFYRSGAYRRLVSAYHGREMGGCDEDYAISVYKFIEMRNPQASILDIGGAPDGLYMNSDIIDPAIDGQTAETFDPAGRQWDLITVCQTVDHLLEPGSVFKKLATCLAPDGVLFFDVVDFDATSEYKIDHPCNFNARSATMLAHVAGLRIDKMERHDNHLRYLCRHW